VLTRWVSGFSLLELLCVLSVTSILAVIGLRGYHRMIQSQHLSLYVQQMTGAIRYARHQAIIRGVAIIFCGSGDGEQCDGNWQQGQMVTQANAVLRYFPGFAKSYHIQWRGSWHQTDQIEFTARGTTLAQQGSFYITQGQRQCRIVLNRMARVRSFCD
jgi:type IV fimbrial biogenesis protein FimT